MTEQTPRDDQAPHRAEVPQHGGDEAGSDVPEVMRGLPVVPHHVNKDVFRMSLKALIVLLSALTVLGIPLGWVIAGGPGVWGAVLGVVVALIFSGTTIWSMLYTADKDPNMTMAVVLGAWLAKMVLFLIILVVLREQDFYHRAIFAVVVLIGVIGSAILDMWAVSKGRTPYVTPQNRDL